MTDKSETPAQTPQTSLELYAILAPTGRTLTWDWPLKPLASLLYLLRSWNPSGDTVPVSDRRNRHMDCFLRRILAAPKLSLSIGLPRFGFATSSYCSLVAGGLHLLLWRLGVQGDEMRYDMRPMMKNTKAFWSIPETLN